MNKKFMTKNYKNLLDSYANSCSHIVDAFADHMDYSVINRHIREIKKDPKIYRINDEFYSFDDIIEVLSFHIPAKVVYDWYALRNKYSQNKGIYQFSLYVYWSMVTRMQTPYTGYESMLKEYFEKTLYYQSEHFRESVLRLWKSIQESVIFTLKNI